MPLLTIFSTPKPFTDPHINIIQRNAIQSWLHLGAEVEVLLIGDEPGLAEAAQEYHIPLITDIQRTAGGTPLIPSIFHLASQASHSPNLLFVNADILLTSDILQAVHHLTSTVASAPYLLLGQRWDLDITVPLDFGDAASVAWENSLRADVKARGSLHPPAGSDYFLFPTHAFAAIPELAIGRAGWDNWIIYHACTQGWQVIDATPDVLIVHQSHDYSHLPGGRPHYNHDESQQNMQLAGGLAHMYTILDAPKQLANGKLRPTPLTHLRLLRLLERRLMPPDGKMRGLRGALARRFRRMRRRLEKGPACMSGAEALPPGSTLPPHSNPDL